MANSTASVYIKPTVAFNSGDTFVFGAWVYTVDGLGLSNTASPCRPTRRPAS
jgi:hypothetical protein